MYDVVKGFEGFENLWGLVVNQIETGTNGKFMAIFFDYYFVTDEYMSAIIYSDDKGETWKMVDSEDRKLEYFHKKVIENNLYLLPSALSVLNKSSGVFEKLMYPFNTMTRYVETASRTLIKTDAKHEPLWIRQGELEWEFPHNIKNAWIKNIGSYYKYNYSRLQYVSDYEDKTLIDSYIYLMNGYIDKNDYFEARIAYSMASTREILFDGVQILYNEEVDYESIVYADSQTLYGFKVTDDKKYQLVRFNFLTETEEELGKYVHANDSGKVFIDVQDQNLLISHRDGIEFSKDAGASWMQVVADNYSLIISPKVYNHDIYIQNGKALLRSTDGNSWENLLEGTSQALIYSFEFDSKNRILVYTSNGAFRSKEPVSVEESNEFIANIDINIYPNPTSDIINIESKESISNIELYNLSGELLSKQNGLTIDAANLSNGTYFIKMQVGEKSIYKQFVVER